MCNELKLFDSELKVMEKLWIKGQINAKDLAQELEKDIGWKKTTTYTVIKKCIDKGAIKRVEPGFICKPLIMKEQIQQFETEELIDKYYDGARDVLISSLLNTKTLTTKEIQKLRQIINNLESGEQNDI